MPTKNENLAAAAPAVAALATGAGEAGIAIVRISGDDALAIADRVVLTAGLPPSRRAANSFFHAKFCDPRTGEVVDDGLVLICHAPHSFSGENTVELQGHGGLVVAQRVLQATFHAGALPAPPGEFTRRAFLNGRLDLTQAEGVLDLITAQTERAARAAREQAQGGLRRRVEALYARLAECGANIEAMLDFDENELPDHFVVQQRQELGAIAAELASLAASWHEGRLLRQGLRVVIAGRVNAGKSSLLNALLGYQRAIVAPTPGTTRDTIEEHFNLDGIPLRLTDTAGLRDAVQKIERAGIARARAALETADLILYVVDGSTPPKSADREALAALPAARTILVCNKADKKNCASAATVARRLAAAQDLSVVTCRANEPEGVAEVLVALRTKITLAAQTTEGVGVVIGERHLQELRDAGRALGSAVEALSAESDLVLAAIPLRRAAESLGRITGRVYNDDLLDSIFARFCVGK